MASVTAIAIAVGVPLSFALIHKGFPVTDVELTTKDVWVTNGETLQAGRLNRQIEELDAAVAAATSDVDVVQNGTNVFLFDRTAGSLERIDPAFTRLVERVDLPPNASVTLGGSTLAILGQDDGKLWTVDVSNQLAFDQRSDPAIVLGKGAHATVSPSGVVFATSPTEQKLYTIAGVGQNPSNRSLTFSTGHQLTAVGDHAVILDTEKNAVVREDGSSVPLGSDVGLKLQQPGADNSVAIVATGNSLLRVPLGSGQVEARPADIAALVSDPGQVSSPVWLDGCAHGAWAGAQKYLLACVNATPQTIAIPDATAGSTVEFRVNKSVIALNNLTNGNVWLVDSDMKLVSNWQLVTPPVEDQAQQGDTKSATQSFEDTLAQRTDQNRPPVARDDALGLREGRTTILPIVENDTDPDGDVLTISKYSPLDPSLGVLDLIDGSRAMQFTPAPGISSATFSYTIDDGRGGSDDAFVSLHVVPASSNAAPVETRTTSISVEARGSISYNVLTDWSDPDGDDLTLVSASPVGGDVARFTPDGFVTFQSKNGELGEKEVRLVVSDGTTQTAGKFIVKVVAAGSLNPIGTPDYARVFVNETVVIKPLDNDISPTGIDLTLTGVDQVPAATTVSPNLEGKSIGFAAATAGSYYFTYGLAAGDKASTGLVRVDVIPDPDAPLPPVAVKDTAYLRAGEPTSISVLNNDVSPSGEVLAVQSVDTSTTNGALSVEVLNNTVIRVTSSNALTTQTQFTYTISDGAQTAVAGVTVVPIPPVAERQPPVAVNDRVSVRAGDFASVHVLDNDYHPDHAQLILNPVLDDVTRVGDGLAFVAGETVRYQAGTTPGEYSVVYRVGDQYGESATASVTFVVVAANLDTNQPPVPAPLVARVFSGNSIPITIPLDGIDPDGDSIVVTAVTQQPTKGVLSNQTENGFVYTANAADAGTDTFKYEVQDIYGAKAIGLVRIGVIPRPQVTDPPNAVDDSVEIKPGRTASVPVLLNDSDPSGYPLSVTKIVEIDDGVTAEIVNNKIVIVAPDVEAAYSLRYQVENGHGGVDTAFVQVKVTSEAKPVYPTAIDYYVPFDDVTGHDHVDVKLADLVSNPAGRDRDLIVSVEGPNAAAGVVDQATQTIRVVPGKVRIAVAYRVTNPDDSLSATAFIIVPPQVSASYSPPPYLRTSLPKPQQLDMNATKTWKLADIVTVPSGRPAIITDAATVVSTNSNGKTSFTDDKTLTFTPAKDYRGPATITFEVTDGADKNDVNGNKATLVLPLTVGDPNFTDAPPAFTTQNVTVEAGEKPLVVDLRASSSHPNPDLIKQFTYTDLTGATDKVHAQISGGDLSVWSDLGVQPGAKTTLAFTVTFKDFQVKGKVGVTTVSSTRPLAQATEDKAKGQRGVAQAPVNVLANDFNPFAKESKPLVLTDAKIENAADSGATLTKTDDGNIAVQPGPSFIGTISVVYTERDATQDPSRDVQGRYLLTVRDVPDQVDPPVAEAGDKQATVDWKTPSTNGEPISGYTVTWTPGDGDGGGNAELAASASSLTVKNLKNGTDYRFRVVAHNVMGASTISDQSNAVRPKGQAVAPTNLSISSGSDGSGNISFNWSGGGANGGEITGYTWKMYNGGTEVASGDAGGATSATWTGNVGTAYAFTVIARATGGDSNPSAKSSTTTPVPGKPTNLTLTANAWNSMTGSYGPAASNGATPRYSWIFTDNNVLHDNAPSSYSFTNSVHGDTSYTLTVTVTVGSVSNSASITGRTPQEPAPPTPHYYGNASTGTCPEQLSGTHYDPSGPTCSSPHGFANGALEFYCRASWGGNSWFLFSGDGYSRSEGWYVKASTLDGGYDTPPNC